MLPASNRRTVAGFTLMELLVVLATLGMLLWMVGELFFPMRASAERQRLQVDARQAARSAVDYATLVLRGASDFNSAPTPRNPGAVITYVWRGDPTVDTTASNPTCPGDAGCVQLTYNNVTAASDLATPGSDVITFATQLSASRMEGGRPWPTPYDNASFQYWIYNGGCGLPNPDVTNQAMFKALTVDPGNSAQSRLLVVMNQDGSSGLPWFFYRITDYQEGDTGNQSTCSVPTCVIGGSAVPVPCFKVAATPASGLALNPPGGLRVLPGYASLAAGTQFTALRVCRGWLEQKNDLFNPATDNNCVALPPGADFPPYEAKAGWSPLIPNVEDFQVVYIFRNGETWNTPTQTLTAAQSCADGVPLAASDPGDPHDVVNVIGFRVTVTGRSAVPSLAATKAPQRPPSAEDHDMTTAPEDMFFRYLVSSTVLLRNRAAGS